MPTLVQLEYLVALDTYRNFSLAAQKCFVTQPTLSMQVKKAEDELGVVIFDRSKQPMIPTDIGQAILAQARVVLREVQRLEQLVADFQNDVSGTLRLGIIPTLAPYLLPLFAGDMVRQFPRLQLHIKELTSEAILADLEQDLLDVGLMVTPLRDTHFHETPLFYEEILLYLHPEHELLQQASIPWQTLQGQRLWLLSQGHCFRHQMLNLCALQQQAESLPFVYESGSLEALRRIVDREGGYTLVPALALSDAPEGQIRHFQAPVPLREVSLVHARSFAKIKLIDLLAAQIRQVVPASWRQAQRGRIVEWRSK